MGNPHCLCLLLLQHHLSTFFLLTSISNFICTLFCPAAASPPNPPEPTESVSLSTVLIRDLLPVSKFSDVADPPDQRCFVCLHDFACCDMTRRLPGHSHVFHRKCLDRWMEYHQNTCPLCRTLIIPGDVELQRDGINETL